MMNDTEAQIKAHEPPGSPGGQEEPCREVRILYLSDHQPPSVLVAAVGLIRGGLVQTSISEMKAPLTACVIPVLTRCDLDCAFRSARLFRAKRVSSSAPIVLINARLSLPESVVADFEDLGCRVSFSDEPSALAQTLALAICTENRIRKRGPIVLWDGTGSPVVRGLQGRSREVRLSAAEHAVLKTLLINGGILSRHELAATTGYESDEVQMFVQRIRRKFNQAGRWVGVKLSAESIIRTVKRRGYRLVVRVRQPE